MSTNCVLRNYVLSVLFTVFFLCSNKTFARDFTKTEDVKKHSITFLSAIGSYESIDLLLKISYNVSTIINLDH